MRRFRKIISSLLLVLLLLVICGSIYLGDYYRADADALEAALSTDKVFISETKNAMVFSPSLPQIGFIFYPGGKVEYTAYAPLMRALAENGILCILVQMPCNLAVLDMNAAEGIPEQYPDITKWYIGGHSLGGSMAASYASKHPEDFEGLALLAAYSTADLSENNLQVISLAGTEDGVLNREKYEKYRSNLPDNMTEIVIDGGNHAFFGSYGLQENDGVAKITAEEQISITTEALVYFFAA